MSESPLLESGQQLYRRYEQQRRSRLSLWFSISNTAAFVLYFIVDTVGLLAGQQKATPGLTSVDASLALFAGVSALAIWFGRRGNSVAAALCIVGPIFLAITGFLTEWSFDHGADTRAYLASTSYLILIALAGLIGNITLMFGTTAIASVVTLYALILLPHSQGLQVTTIQLSNILTVEALEWGFLLIMFFALSGYRRTLRQLGDVQIQYERAKALDDLKNQFITSVNHELRNPVMAMQGYLDILEMSIERESREKIQSLIKRASSAGDALRALLSSILDARRLEQGADDFVPEAVSVRQTLATAITLIDPQEVKTDLRDLRVSIPESLHIWGEPVRLQQVLTNLLSNALKYSPPGAPVDIAAQFVLEDETVPGRLGRKHHHERRMVEICVRDYGHGIPPDQIPFLFQRFVRLPRDLASTVIGNGLGLFVSRALVEAMGGRIWVESTGIEGEGSTFIVRLPPAPASDPLLGDALAPVAVQQGVAS